MDFMIIYLMVNAFIQSHLQVRDNIKASAQKEILA